VKTREGERSALLVDYRCPFVSWRSSRPSLPMQPWRVSRVMNVDTKFTEEPRARSSKPRTSVYRVSFPVLAPPAGQLGTLPSGRCGHVPELPRRPAADLSARLEHPYVDGDPRRSTPDGARNLPRTDRHRPRLRPRRCRGRPRRELPICRRSSSVTALAGAESEHKISPSFSMAAWNAMPFRSCTCCKAMDSFLPG
jgi:hypothetical protein